MGHMRITKFRSVLVAITILRIRRQPARFGAIRIRVPDLLLFDGFHVAFPIVHALIV